MVPSTQNKPFNVAEIDKNQRLTIQKYSCQELACASTVHKITNFITQTRQQGAIDQLPTDYKFKFENREFSTNSLLLFSEIPYFRSIFNFHVKAPVDSSVCDSDDEFDTIAEIIPLYVSRSDEERTNYLNSLTFVKAAKFCQLFDLYQLNIPLSRCDELLAQKVREDNELLDKRQILILPSMPRLSTAFLVHCAKEQSITFYEAVESNRYYLTNSMAEDNYMSEHQKKTEEYFRQKAYYENPLKYKDVTIYLETADKIDDCLKLISDFSHLFFGLMISPNNINNVAEHLELKPLVKKNIRVIVVDFLVSPTNDQVLAIVNLIQKLPTLDVLSSNHLGMQIGDFPELHRIVLDRLNTHPLQLWGDIVGEVTNFRRGINSSYDLELLKLPNLGPISADSVLLD